MLGGTTRSASSTNVAMMRLHVFVRLRRFAARTVAFGSRSGCARVVCVRLGAHKHHNHSPPNHHSLLSYHRYHPPPEAANPYPKSLHPNLRLLLQIR